MKTMLRDLWAARWYFAALTVMLGAFAMAGCIAATSEPPPQYRYQSGMAPGDSLLTLELYDVSGARFELKRQVRTFPEPDSALKSLDAYIERIDSVLMHTRILRDLYREAHEK